MIASMLSYAGGDKLYVPVENIDVLSRYGSESEGVALDKLGGVAWQARKARMKERIREIAGELMATAAARALRERRRRRCPTPQGYAEFADRFPYSETDDQLNARSTTCSATSPAAGRWTGWCAATSASARPRSRCAPPSSRRWPGSRSRVVCPTTLLARQHFAGFRERFAGFPIEVGRLSRLVTATRGQGDARGARRRHDRHRRRHPCDPRQVGRSSSASASSSSTRSSASASPPRSG